MRMLMALTERLEALLHLHVAPIGLTWSVTPPEGVPPFGRPLAAPAADGRTGRVPAGCVFWIHATETTFTTVAEDHGNCSVGAMTHGFAALEDVAGNDDVAALVGSGWVSMDDVPGIPTIPKGNPYLTYGPVRTLPMRPDVILLRLNAKQMMVLADGVPDLVVEGKPQCHILALAKESDVIAASVGCMLSRVRTGMPSTEMTCAIPTSRLADVVERLEQAAPADAAVARCAAADAARFAAL